MKTFLLSETDFNYYTIESLDELENILDTLGLIKNSGLKLPFSFKFIDFSEVYRLYDIYKERWKIQEYGGKALFSLERLLFKLRLDPFPVSESFVFANAADEVISRLSERLGRPI